MKRAGCLFYYMSDCIIVEACMTYYTYVCTFILWTQLLLGFDDLVIYGDNLTAHLKMVTCVGIFFRLLPHGQT